MGFLTSHEYAVVSAATARLIPGPDDDPAEAGSPGAREANVVGYIDELLASLDGEPPRVFVAGPFSARTAGAEIPTRFVRLTRAQRAGWIVRIGALRERYRVGIKLLDALSGGDFSAASPRRQDETLCHPLAVGFRTTLFDHAVEGMFSLPEYGGNRAAKGWDSILYPGDRHAAGYSVEEVELSDGPDPLPASALLDGFLACHRRAVWLALADDD